MASVSLADMISRNSEVSFNSFLAAGWEYHCLQQ
jgi:hypothetical protein